MAQTLELPGREQPQGHFRREEDKDKNPYSCAIAAGTLLLAGELVRLEKRRKRKLKKLRVLSHKRSMIKEAFPRFTAGHDLKRDATRLISPKWPRAEASAFILDLAFTKPFSPYELKYKDKHFTIALENVANLVHLSIEDVIRIRGNQRRAYKVYRYVRWKKILLYGLGRFALAGALGYFAAPLLVAYIGALAGLSGAAATAQGLTLLSGSSLALGGQSMAGGLWILTATHAGGSFVGAGSSQLLLQLTPTNARTELVKLQVSYKEMLLGNGEQVKRAREVLKLLAERRDEIKEQIEEERGLNERSSHRIGDMKETLAAVEKSLKWMKKELVES